MKDRLIDFIRHGHGDFNSLALKLFERHYRLNLPFRGFCQSTGSTPENVEDWRQIPTVPTDVFRFATLFCVEHVRIDGSR